MKPQVRLARIDEAALVREAMLAAFAEYEERAGLASSAAGESLEDVRGYLERGAAVLALSGGDAIGSVRFEPREGFAYIGRLAVLPAWRGQGIAGRMMDLLEETIRARGLAEARLEVRMALPENRSLFEKRGYLLARVYPHYREAAHDVGLMIKEL